MVRRGWCAQVHRGALPLRASEARQHDAARRRRLPAGDASRRSPPLRLAAAAPPGTESALGDAPARQSRRHQRVGACHVVATTREPSAAAAARLRADCGGARRFRSRGRRRTRRSSRRTRCSPRSESSGQRWPSCRRVPPVPCLGLAAGSRLWPCKRQVASGVARVMAWDRAGHVAPCGGHGRGRTAAGGGVVGAAQACCGPRPRLHPAPPRWHPPLPHPGDLSQRSMWLALAAIAEKQIAVCVSNLWVWWLDFVGTLVELLLLVLQFPR